MLHTPGHTAGHLCVVDRESRAIMVGDHVLPTITPSVAIAIGTERRGSFVEYFNSLRTTALWDDFEVLPGHERRFHGLNDRAIQLYRKHRERMMEIVAAVEAQPSTIWELLPRLSWRRGHEALVGTHLRSALSIVGAMVDFLVASERIRVDVSTDSCAQGVIVHSR